MPTIESRVEVAAPIDKVFEIARDAESFPEFMPDVKELEIVEANHDQSLTKTRWVGKIPQFNLTIKWTQEDKWDLENRRVDFKQLEGDYDRMEGFWQFTESNGVTVFESRVDYEYNVPLLGQLVKKVIHHLAKKNVESAMEAIAKKAQA